MFMVQENEAQKERLEKLYKKIEGGLWTDSTSDAVFRKYRSGLFRKFFRVYKEGVETSSYQCTSFWFFALACSL